MPFHAVYLLPIPMNKPRKYFSKSTVYDRRVRPEFRSQILVCGTGTQITNKLHTAEWTAKKLNEPSALVVFPMYMIAIHFTPSLMSL